MKRSTYLRNFDRPTAHKSRLRHFVEHPFGVPLLVFVTLILLGAGISYWFLWQQRVHPRLKASENYIVIVTHDGVTQTVPTNAKTVGDVLTRLHIAVAPTDRVEPATNQPITNDNFLINVYRSAPFAIIDNGTEIRAKNAAATPRSAATEAGVKLYPEDQITSAPTKNFLLQTTIGTVITVKRATVVSLELYGQPLTVRTQAKTVGELLKEKKIVPTKEDTVRPADTTPITPNMTVAVVRNGIHTITVTEAIPPPVTTILDMSLSFGSQAVRQEGSPGEELSTYQITNQNGVEVSRRLLQRVVTVEPVARIIAKGSTSNIPGDKQAVMAAAGIPPSDYPYVDYIFSRESHWNAAAVSSNGYYGLGQTSYGRMTSACPNWQNDPVCQTRLFSAYAGRYGGWQGAYNFWASHGWW